MPNKNENQRHLVLKNAKVPLKTCLKLALKNMWKKKFRYLVMFIICALSLTFFSVTIELNGEKLRQNVYTMIENGYRYTDIYKHVPVDEDAIKENEYNAFLSEPLPENSLTEIKENVSNITIHEYKDVQIYYTELDLENSNYFYTGYINSIIKFDETNTYNLIAGRLPKPNTKEILITDYLVAAFEYFNLYPQCNNIYDYLNLRLDLVHQDDYVIVGIIETNYEQWTHFSTIEDVSYDDKENYSFTNEFVVMNSVILNDKYFEIEKIGKSSIIGFSNDVNGQITCVGKWTFSAESLTTPGVTNYYGYNMPEGQSPILGSYGITANNTELVKRYSRWDNSTFGRYPITDNEIVISYKLVNKLFGLNWTMYNNGAGYDYYISRQHVRMWEQINGKEITITLNGYKGNDTEYTKTYKVVGITDTMDKVGGYSANLAQVTPSEYQNIYYTYNTFEQKILVELPDNSPEAYNLFNRALNAGYVIDVWAYQQDIDTYIVDPFLDLASKAGLFIFAIFTMGIMWTIISIEIVDSKKEIGILRSIGLSGGKVAFIFIFQAASVVFLAYFLGVYGGYKLVPYLNIGITDELGKITLFMYSFTYRTPLYLALLVILMTAISTAIPLFKILSQKIIDVINERDN